MKFRLLVCLIIMSCFIGNLFGRELIWQKDLACDANMGCSPAVVAADVNANKLIILGASIRDEGKEGDFLIWEMDTNGNISNRSKFGKMSKESAAMPLSLQLSGLSIKGNNDIIVLGKFDGNTPSSSLLTMNRKGNNLSVKSLENSEPAKKVDGAFILKMKPVFGNSLAIVGRQGSNGFITKMDELGNEVWKKIFDINYTEIFSDVASGSTGLYVAGQSVQTKPTNKTSFGSKAQNFLLFYDMDGQLIKQDYFEGVCSTKFPQVARMSSGIVLVAYDRSENITATDLNIRAYNPDLKFLWETQVVTTDGNGPPGYFKILAVSSDRFFIGTVFNGGELVIAECSSDGQVMERWSMGKVVGPFGELQLVTLSKKVYAVFSTISYGELQNVRIKVLAFAIE